MGEPGVGAVGVDRLEALGGDLEARKRRLGLEARPDLPDQVLDEARSRVGALGDVFLVRPLEDRVEVAGGARFDERDEVLDPEELREPDLDPDDAALVVRGALADRLAARTQAGDRHLDAYPEIGLLLRPDPPDPRAQRAGKVDEAPAAGDGAGLLDEVG